MIAAGEFCKVTKHMINSRAPKLLQDILIPGKKISLAKHAAESKDRDLFFRQHYLLAQLASREKSF